MGFSMLLISLVITKIRYFEEKGLNTVLVFAADNNSLLSYSTDKCLH